jgi:hypothetical protein
MHTDPFSDPGEDDQELDRSMSSAGREPAEAGAEPAQQGLFMCLLAGSLDTEYPL